ncbi:DUF4167 domain-containing protein [Brucella gallinifaecis]|uniref:DUF4167 domain-containing protein n=1 Tax=Brucella gallinifaecis TaxID=215590 RepID=A0A502BN77_9HYPH|nr:DUF4167 domain-containing protein [Brucella gallinifaecis]TPF74746.1 DUF4167 domain-containing protein [Brucella gallinifaecis]
MRPAQQNRRMRGRGNNNNNNNNNNRKGPNPLSRNYESNGPDVKIRGNAQHIAEKYTTLARDAQASGDRVMAENYLQHAEHYNRIIMAAMAAQNIPYQREENFDNDGGDEDESGLAPAVPVHQPVNGSGPQPVIEGTPAEVVYGEDGNESRLDNRSDNRPDNRSQPREGREGRDGRDARDGRDQRRLGRGRRPQRERFNADETSEQPVVEAAIASATADEQPVQAPVQVQAPVIEKPDVETPVAETTITETTITETPAVRKTVRAEKPAKVAAEAEAVVEKPAPVVEAAAEAPAKEEAPVRVTRRPGRPRRVPKDEVPETADSDA